MVVVGRAKAWTISIHAPREGGDIGNKFSNFTWDRNFNPRPPRGGRHSHGRFQSVYPYFNPRPPRGGRLPRMFVTILLLVISIHAPREGGDSKDAQFYLRIFDK